MFWKIFAWINLITNLPLLIGGVFLSGGMLLLIDFLVIGLNDVVLLTVPFLFTYKIYDIKYLSNIILLKTVLIFTILYNATNIFKDLIAYNFTTIPGLLLDAFLYALVVLSIISFVLYIMDKYKISLSRVFLK